MFKEFMLKDLEGSLPILQNAEKVKCESKRLYLISAQETHFYGLVELYLYDKINDANANPKFFNHDGSTNFEKINEEMKLRISEKNQFIIQEKNTNRVVGCSYFYEGRHFINKTEKDLPQELPMIGYRIHPDCNGRGYATEIVKEFSQYVSQHVYKNNIYAMIDKVNIGSKIVAKKSGFSELCDITYCDTHKGSLFIFENIKGLNDAKKK